MRRFRSGLILASAMVLVLGGRLPAQPSTRPAAGPQRWEEKITQFEQQDRKTPPPRDSVLFIGSSSIVGWKLKEYFPQMPTINRGFGGSEIADSLYFVDRIVIPYRPRVIVFYAGENDIAAFGKSPEQVADEFRRFTEKVRAALPQTRIIFIGLKPSPSRWKFIDQFREANRLIRQFIATRSQMSFIDVESMMLDEQGNPREELYLNDKLHMTRAGYELWSRLVQAELQNPTTQPIRQ
jgi:lysophospholipase L1-like esterase